MTSSGTLLRWLAAGACLCALGQISTAYAAVGDPASADTQQGPTASAAPVELKEIRVIGLRYRVRSVLDSPSAIDIIGTHQLEKHATSDVVDLLRDAIPSFNTNDNAISGTATEVRPAEMRGLAPDMTLILIDGKRWHRSADIADFSSALSDFSEAPDLASLAERAFCQVQVLRDGAGAQYGADALAGVINFVPCKQQGGYLAVKGGKTYHGDGANAEIDGAYGVPLGLDHSGYARVTVQFSGANATDRSVPLFDLQQLQTDGFTRIPPSPRMGTPKVRANLRTFLNFGVPISQYAEFYGFGGFARRTTTSDFFYRDPSADDSELTFTTPQGQEAFLIGTLNPQMPACAGGINPATGTVTNPILVNQPNSVAQLNASLQNTNCFSFLAPNLYPGGYVPWFGSKLQDSGGYMGVRGTLPSGLHYDASAGYGRNSIQFFLQHDINPSLGPASPTDWPNIGTRIQQEYTENIDVTYPLHVAYLASPLHLAGGVEQHTEQWQCDPGPAETFANGPLSTQGFHPANGDIECQPTDFGVYTRDNFAAYVDVAANPTKRWTVDIAGRDEKFSDSAGNWFTYKLATMFHFTPALGLRATYSEGVHDPSPGQRHFESISDFIGTNGTNQFNGIVSPTNPIAVALGGKPLTAEVAHDATVGFVVDTQAVKATLDLYGIDMAHRLTESQLFALTPAQQQALYSQGVLNALNFNFITFATNAFDSRTYGGDFKAAVPLTFVHRGRTTANVSWNYNFTNVLNSNSPTSILGPDRALQLEGNLPHWRGILSVTHVEAQWFMTLRTNYYGPFVECHVNNCALRIDAGAKATVDLEGGYAVSDNLRFQVGIENLLNRYPSSNPYGSLTGAKYPLMNPFGNNGGIWYAQVTYKLP